MSSNHNVHNHAINISEALLILYFHAGNDYVYNILQWNSDPGLGLDKEIDESDLITGAFECFANTYNCVSI